MSIRIRSLVVRILKERPELAQPATLKERNASQVQILKSVSAALEITDPAGKASLMERIGKYYAAETGTGRFYL